MSDTWTIGELAERAALALRDGAPVNGRVRDVPGERLIRWYTTIGLVDPPLTRRGRTAQYGRRHLLQLVAVKRLQAVGNSIADIQAALTGATDRTLEATARLDDAALTDGTAPPKSGAAAGSGAAGDGRLPGPGRSTRERFWAERPGDGSTGTAAGTADEMGGADVADGTRAGAAAVIAGVRLGDGVRLVLDARRPLAAQDVQAVLAAAGPLLAVLEERELI
ncbi:helix-turn-helix domain-containing protein [Nonomuraea sp. NPDC002799]